MRSNLFLFFFFSVVCIRSSALQKDGYQDLTEWCKYDNHLYIGRSVSAVEASKWHNPYRLREYTLEKCLELYEKHVRGSRDLMGALPELAGKALGCWCAPSRCHGDVLLKLLGEYFPDGKTYNVLVVGHSFVSHLSRKIKHQEIQWKDPANYIGKGINVNMHGFPGATLDTIVSNVDRLLQKYRPQVLICVIGGNDISNRGYRRESFEESLDDLYSHCRRWSCQLVVNAIWQRLMPRFGTVEMYNTRRAEIYSLYHSKKKEWQGFYFFRCRSSTRTDLLDRDGVHPSGYGYHTLCDSLSRTLGQFLWKSGELK